jgi:ligand-binding SRPBCC domain-containing protein
MGIRVSQTGDMRVQLKLVLDAPPDAVWAALRSPGVLSEVAHPFFSFEPLSPRGLPRFWPEGQHPVRASLLWGLIPVGEQVIDISYRERGDTRIIEDSGGPVSGPLAVITRWRHRMAVTRTEDDRTLYRDRLDISAGLLTPLVWIGAWAFWQWRAFQLTRLAPAWKAPA